MDKECKKFIKKIKQLDEGDCLDFNCYEILCLTPKSSFMVIDEMNMIEYGLDDVVEFIINQW